MYRLLCLLLALIQVLPSLGAIADGPMRATHHIGMDRQTLGTVGMGYGVTGVEHHQYLVDTSQPYAEVIQEAEWVNNALPLITRYDIGLDRLRMFKYQVTSNGPPPVFSPVLSGWYLFDGLGNTRAVVDDGGVGQSEFGYGDAFGIPYQVAANGTRASAGAGFFLNGQQWDGSGVWNSGEGLYFNRARYYQPGLGRFIGEDRYKGYAYKPSTLHRYRYAGNDPVNMIDRSGMIEGGISQVNTMALAASLAFLFVGAVYLQAQTQAGQTASFSYTSTGTYTYSMPNPYKKPDVDPLQPPFPPIQDNDPENDDKYTVYRFLSPDKQNSYKSKYRLAMEGTDMRLRSIAQSHVDLNLGFGIDILKNMASAHANPGRQIDFDFLRNTNLVSPFISVTFNFMATAASPDTELAGIVRNASHIARFRVPKDRIFLLENILSLEEQEALFVDFPLLSPMLKEYRDFIIPNPWKK